MLAALPADRAGALATLAHAHLLQGRSAEALASAAEATAILTAVGGFGLRGTSVRLVHAEALRAASDHEGATRALTDLTARLLAQAERIADPALRRSFLEDVPANRRAFELAAAWMAVQTPPDHHKSGVALGDR